MSNESDQEKVLARWLSGELSEDDRQLLNQEKGLDDLRFALDDLEGWKVPEPDIHEGLKDLRSRIVSQSRKKETKQVFFQPWLRVAASVILIGAVYFIFNALMTSGPTVISTGFGETISHVLPDGSRIDLDANSSISYSAKNWGDERALNLDGRALFTVQKGESFKVDTEAGSVTVLGTVFDVTQRERGVLKVNCFEGRVRVDIDETKELLTAGQGLVADNGKIDRLEVSGSAPPWLSKKARFIATPLNEVVTTLEAFHGVDISIEGSKQSDPFTGELDYSDLERALETLSTVFEMSFTRKGDKVIFE